MQGKSEGGTADWLRGDSILNSLNDGVYVTDRERRILLWNDAAERIMGWTRDDVVGRTCYDSILCHEDKEGRRLCGNDTCPMHRSILTGNSSTVPYIVFAQSKDNRRVPVQVTVAPVHDEAGEVVGGVEVFRDLSGLMGDLNLARTIQQSAMEWSVPPSDRIRLEALSVAHDQVGGDFHRVEEIGTDRHVLLVADVMGHGAAAALYTMQIRSLWEEHRGLLDQPGKLLRAFNSRICVLTQGTGHFATAFCALIDGESGTVRCASAGHNPPLVIRGDDTVEETECRGFPLGFMADAVYEEHTVTVAPGDTLLVYTDGAVELSETVTLTEQDLGLIAAKLRSNSDGILLDRLSATLLNRSNALSFPDDMTLLQAHFPA